MLKIKSDFYPNQVIVTSIDNDNETLEGIRIVNTDDFLIFIHKLEYNATKEFIHNFFKTLPDGWHYLHTRHFQKYSIVDGIVTIPGNIFFQMKKKLGVEVNEFTSNQFDVKNTQKQ